MCRRTGDNSEEGTPVPIPNTVVKLFSSDDTLGVAPRENKTSPFHPPTPAVFSVSTAKIRDNITPPGFLNLLFFSLDLELTPACIISL